MEVVMDVRHIVVLLSLCAAPALGAVDPAMRCCEAKLRASGSREAQLLRCHATAAARGATVATNCVAAVEPALMRALSRGGCGSAGEAAVVAGELVADAQDVADDLRPTSLASACAARKLKAASHLATALLRAYARNAVTPNAAALDAAVTEARADASAAFARAEARGGCLTTGDAGPVISLVHGADQPQPGGVLRTVGRLCASCGDGVRGGPEACDGGDIGSCESCRADCACATCGDGAVNRPGESCDGGDDANCPGLCGGDCSCPFPVCGNGVVEQGEQCEGSVCLVPGVGFVAECSGAGSGGCRCCGGAFCQQLGCCDPSDLCLPVPNGLGSCFRRTCGPHRPCVNGWTCVDDSATPEPGVCVAELGTFCTYLGQLLGPCRPPATCPGGYLSRCCLPSGEQCSVDPDCCGGACSGGVCS
jgi:hypothetical protein